MFRTLERPQFAAVQSKLFPIYFSLQTAAPVVLAITHPGNASLLSLDGLLATANRWTALAPIAAMFTSALLNLVVLLPATTNVMAKRRLQGKPSYFTKAPPPLSQGARTPLYRDAVLIRCVRCREEGRQEVVGAGTSVPGDDCPEQEVRQTARHLIAPQPHDLYRYHCVRVPLGRPPSLDTLILAIGSMDYPTVGAQLGPGDGNNGDLG